MNPNSYIQIIKDDYGKVVFQTVSGKDEVKSESSFELKPKRVRSFNGLPGFECNVKKVKYVCDGEGRNPKGTELYAFVMNKNDINAYLVYVPRQDGFNFTAFMLCKEISPGKYTHDKNLNGVII